MDLTQPRIKELAQHIYDMHFEMNSLLDNVNNYLDIDSNLPKFAEFVHEILAHKIPLQADEIADFAKRFNTRIGRGAVSAHLANYDSPINAIKAGLDYAILMNSHSSEAIDECINLNNKNWEDFFRDYENRVITPYIHQLNKFFEGLKDYDEDNIVVSFNKDFVAYIVPEFQQDWQDYVNKNND